MTPVATWPVWAQAVVAAALAGVAVLAAGPRAVALLSALGSRQQIREDAPARHQAKAGVPTMGGLVIVGAVVVATLIAGGWTGRTAFGLAGLLGFGAIGFLDDLRKVRRGRNLGLRARERLALQLALGLLLGGIAAATMSTSVRLPGGAGVPLGAAYALFVALWLAGFANAVNLTDGLDGLAAGLAAAAAAGLAVVAARRAAPDVTVAAAAIAGAALAFLSVNAHPARLIMGDVGSNALGGGLAALAVATGAELPMLILGGVFVAEAVSVLAQVAYFKATGGRRIFRMSPLHHHFELAGWSEPQVVRRFYAAGSVCLVLGVVAAR
ncbi:MAG: phospho-N-acetylmuramoyl-pentapeptide-transferase [Armatimonadota bacterium]|nr:phospho-N-acetylmuramoyl-pentapeptide-transferase [Armatimonadota bacterium]MDR7534354.1 phospho-N-acetylmuramoyl-pentapeptide-transferase [Armatimonadota bacterium]MDR7536010.1 phospho-N-acetylmuramoyl-pentapeptide-transferase [Armatimonadota bacterium]